MVTETTPALNLSQLLDVARDGDPVAKKEAREQLVAALYERTVLMVKAMLRDFPVVQQHRTIASLPQDLWIRLLRALDAKVHCQTTAEFLRIAKDRLWRFLVDEANKYRGRERATKKQHPHGDGQIVALGQLEGQGSGVGFDPAGPESLDPTNLAEWVEFHERVAALPEKEREVWKVRYYLGATHKEAAEALGLTESEAKHAWLRACLKLEPYLPQLK